MLVWSLSHRCCPSSVRQGPCYRVRLQAEAVTELVPCLFPGPRDHSSAAAHTCLQYPCVSNLTWASITSLHTNLQHGESTMDLLTQAFTKQKESKMTLLLPALRISSTPVAFEQGSANWPCRVITFRLW